MRYRTTVFNVTLVKKDNAQKVQTMVTRRNGRRGRTDWIKLLIFGLTLILAVPTRNYAAGAPPAAVPETVPLPGLGRWDGPPGQEIGDSETAPADPAASIDEQDWAPDGLAETFTSKVFWCVLALVVLGSLVLMADFPDEPLDALSR
jgi:hypothetical protein